MKRFLLIALSVLMALSLTGCKNSTPESAVKNFLEEQKKEVGKIIEEELSFGGLADDELAGILKEMIAGFDYTINETVIDDDGDAIVSVAFKTYKIGDAFSNAVFETLITSYSSLANSDMDENALTIQILQCWKETLTQTKTEGKTYETEVKMTVVKENGNWIVNDNSEELADALVGGLFSVATSITQ